jgi:hypothetical protein
MVVIRIMKVGKIDRWLIKLLYSWISTVECSKLLKIVMACVKLLLSREIIYLLVINDHLNQKFMPWSGVAWFVGNPACLRCTAAHQGLPPPPN